MLRLKTCGSPPPLTACRDPPLMCTSCPTWRGFWVLPPGRWLTTKPATTARRNCPAHESTFRLDTTRCNTRLSLRSPVGGRRRGRLAWRMFDGIRTVYRRATAMRKGVVGGWRGRRGVNGRAGYQTRRRSDLRRAFCRPFQLATGQQGQDGLNRRFECVDAARQTCNLPGVEQRTARRRSRAGHPPSPHRNSGTGILSSPSAENAVESPDRLSDDAAAFLQAVQ